MRQWRGGEPHLGKRKAFNKAKLRRAALTVFLLFALAGFSGCKYSPVLHELIQDRFEEFLHEKSAEEFENNDGSQNETDKLTEKKQSDDSQRKKQEKETTPVSGDESNLSDASELSPNDNSDREGGLADKMADGGTEDPMDQQQNGGGTGDPMNQQQNGGGSAEQPDTASGGMGNGGTGDDGFELVPGTDGVRQIADGRGVLVSVPENVTSAAAPGQAAELLYLVGGEDLIRAASEQFLGSGLINLSAFSEAQPLWQGDGTTAMTDDSFERLLNTAPDVCIEISGNSAFTDRQLTELQNAGVPYVVLPPLDSLENIQEAVRLTGSIVGDRSSQGGADGNQLAENYCQYVEKTAADVASKVKGAGISNGFSDINQTGDGYYKGKFSLYIAGWDDEAHYKLANSRYVTREGVGAAYTGNSSTALCRAVSSFLALGGVENTMACYETVKSKNAYVTPIVTSTRKLTIEGSMASEVNGDRLLQMLKAGLGEDSFPAIIVDSRETAEKLKADPLWAVYGHVVSGDGNFEANGFLAEDGSIVGTSVTKPYEIYVNPSGIGSWSSGSGESILESVWTAWKFYDAYSEAEVRSMIKEFYSVFYRIDLSEAQINEILN